MFTRAALVVSAGAGACWAQPGAPAQDAPAAQPADEPAQPPEGSGRPPFDLFELTLRSAHIFDASVSDQGDVSVSSLAVRFSAQYPVTRELVLGVSAGTGTLFYDFDGPSKLVPGDQSPWDNIRVSSVGTNALWRRGRWVAFGGLNLSSAGEDGADFNDTLTVGGSGAASYAVSPKLRIGAGITAQTRLDDNPFVLPFPTLDWVLPGDPQERWRLQIGAQRLGPSRAASGGITFTPSEKFSIAAGVTAVGLGGEFRLDDDGPAPGGVGRDSSFPALLSVDWTPSPPVTVNVFGGVTFGTELELLDSGGARIGRRNVRSAPVIGLNVNFTF